MTVYLNNGGEKPRAVFRLIETEEEVFIPERRAGPVWLHQLTLSSQLQKHRHKDV
ncbi:hypothetical protein ABVT39_023932, partial [Epinephelus coioides]